MSVKCAYQHRSLRLWSGAQFANAIPRCTDRTRLTREVQQLKQHMGRREQSFNDERKGFFRDVMMLKELAKRNGLDDESQMHAVAASIEHEIEDRMRNNSGSQAAQTEYFAAESRRNEELVAKAQACEKEVEALQEYVPVVAR